MGEPQPCGRKFSNDIVENIHNRCNVKGKMMNKLLHRSFRAVLGVLSILVFTTGCAGLTPAQRGGAALLTGSLAITPSADVEQTYYLGSFDPQGQLPPAVYRIRVRGQSSILNTTRFASSWVPAAVVDSLSRTIAVDAKDGAVTFGGSAAADSTSALTSSGRGLVMFGPEGFREAPRGHRLVVIMGANPEVVEQAFSSALGAVAQVKFGESGNELDQTLFARLVLLSSEKERLRAIGGQP